ncbi:TPA: hypothetical protein H1940_004762 [Salmonella enterica]|nr:hypothetical protein [Salmonella enterica]
MEQQFSEQDIQEVRDHVDELVSALADLQRQFLCVIDPSESPETLEYVRNVAYAFDEVVLAVYQMENSEEHRKMVYQSSEIMIQNLIDYHNENEARH